MIAALLLLACTPDDPEGALRRGRQGDPQGDPDTDTGDSGGADSGEPDSGETGQEDTAPDEADTCTHAGPRGLCTLDALEGGEADGIDVSDGLRLAAEGLTAGTDTTGVYNGGAYQYGVWTSPALSPGLDFDAAIPSWNAETPAGTWISVHLSARLDGGWTDWYRLGVWASGDTDLARHSFDGESDADGDVWTDTLSLDEAADAVKIRVVLFTADGVATPVVRRLAVAVADSDTEGTDAGGEAWGVALDVPARSQMVFDEGEAWCSPTSTSMLLAYWGVDVSVPEAAEGTWDDVYEGNGNWPFNVAYAASLGLVGHVGWLGAVSDLEPWIAAGVPVAVSAAWGPGELDDAPISSTAGHLLVVTGFTADGDVRVNDPASASDAAVPRTYDRQQFADAWMGGSGGVAYLLWKP